MKKLFTAIVSASIVLASAQTVLAANQFNTNDLGVSVLGNQTVTEKLINSVFGTTDKYLASVPGTLKAVTNPVKKYKSNFQGKILNVAKTKQPELHQFLKKYGDLTKSHMAYEQVKVSNKADLKGLSEQVNKVLRSSYQVVRTVNLANDMLGMAEKDVKSAMTGKDVVSSAGVGIVAISINNMSLSAYRQSMQLDKDVKNLIGQITQKSTAVQKKITANPLSALSMGEEVSLLADMGSKLTGVSGEMAGSVQKIPSLMDKTVKLMGQVKL